MPPGEPVARAAYDALADEYAAEMDDNPYTAHFERPATTSLIPEVDGARILDAGCGTGWYSAWLHGQGASPVGVDVSEEMLAYAEERVPDARFLRAALDAPLPFPSETFDGVVSGLTLGYVRDWTTAMDRFARVLKTGGFLVFSVLHPMDTFDPDGESVYYEVEPATKEWTVDVPFYRRPFAAVVQPVLDAGFKLEQVCEPRPTAAFQAAWPERYETESREPVFLCLRARLT